jgi:MOSC domain-containing protein YiiM
MTGRVDAIHITHAESAPLHGLASVRAIAGVGLEGDRYATRVGHYSDDSAGRHLTLIESEVLADLAARDLAVPPGGTRRNLTTSGVALNDLVGHRFRVGVVECVGVRLCEPCTYMEGLVGVPVMRPLVHRGGLRADILTGGEIRVGDAIVDLGTADATAEENLSPAAAR